MTLLDLCDSTAKLYYMLCRIKYTKPCWVWETVWNIILYCYCYFSTSIHMGVPEVAEAEWSQSDGVHCQTAKIQVFCPKPKSKSKCCHFQMMHWFFVSGCMAKLPWWMPGCRPYFQAANEMVVFQFRLQIVKVGFRVLGLLTQAKEAEFVCSLRVSSAWNIELRAKILKDHGVNAHTVHPNCPFKRGRDKKLYSQWNLCPWVYPEHFYCIVLAVKLSL